MLLLNHPELWQFIFFKDIFHKNSQTIYMYCFSQYQKYLREILSCGPIQFNPSPAGNEDD